MISKARTEFRIVHVQIGHWVSRLTDITNLRSFPTTAEASVTRHCADLADVLGFPAFQTMTMANGSQMRKEKKIHPDRRSLAAHIQRLPVGSGALTEAPSNSDLDAPTFLPRSLFSNE